MCECVWKKRKRSLLNGELAAKQVGARLLCFIFHVDAIITSSDTAGRIAEPSPESRRGGSFSLTLALFLFLFFFFGLLKTPIPDAEEESISEVRPSFVEASGSAEPLRAAASGGNLEEGRCPCFVSTVFFFSPLLLRLPPKGLLLDFSPVLA